MKPFADVPELADTAQHLEVIHRKLDRLTRAKVEAWEQMLCSAARLYSAGELTAGQLRDMFEAMRDSYGPAFTKVWNRVMPVPANRVRHVAEREAQQCPPGQFAWSGIFPIDRQPAPPPGRSVVYVLFDATNEPVYVGSTQDFRNRMAGHRKEKPGLAAWTAYPCRDREHAYELEVSLLAQHRPRMNRKVGR